jgi:hypothetical protein
VLQVAFEQGHNVHFHHHDINYVAYQHFYNYFSADWAVRTEDPWEANMFYIPAVVHAAAGELTY